MFLAFLRLLWRRKLMVAAGALLPMLFVGVLLYLWPRQYMATSVYERPLTESEYNVLLRRFYNSENLAKICSRLQEKKLTAYASKLSKAQARQSLEDLIQFTVSPAYPRRLQTTDPATSERIGTLRAQLLTIEILGDSESQVSDASAVVTTNFEDVLPLYDIRNALKDLIQEFEVRASEIEDTRFTLTVDLTREKARLEQLEGLEAAAAQATADNVVLQFTDVRNSREFLPLAYQTLAVRSKIIDLEGTLKSNKDKYDYYVRVLDLNDKLLTRIEASLLNDSTVPQFMEFLGEQLLACKDEATADYLRAYIRKTDNLVSVNTRAGEKPVIYPVSKQIVKRSILTFVVFLMLAVFAAVLLEHRDGRHRSPSDSAAVPGPKQ